ncbi:hypothetical protein SUGI_0864820 [Cryptomeria japonica]|nr:hypothetical protein SUGI_0864820 [Cryptomeria japonica]
MIQAPGEEFEEHMKWGAKQRRTRERNHIKNNVENSDMPLGDEAFESVPSPHEVISWSRAELLKNDTESMIIDLMEEDEDDDECCEMETEEAEGQMPIIDEVDMDNPLVVTDYVQDIYSFYHEREKVLLSNIPDWYLVASNY